MAEFGLTSALIGLAGWFFGGLSLKVGAKLTGVRVGIGRAMLAVLISGGVGWGVILLVSMIFPPLAWLLGLVAVLGILKLILGISWTSALGVWLLFLIVQVIFFVLAFALTGFGLLQLMPRLEPILPGGGMEVWLQSYVSV